MCEVEFGIGDFELLHPVFGNFLGTRRSGFEMGLGSRDRAVDASGWLTLRRDRLFFLSLATRQRTGTLADSSEFS